MKKRRLELSVGVFVLIGAVCLAYLTLVLGRVGGLGLNEYPVFAEFDSVEGLREGASVEIAGVPVGRVGQIALVEYRARVEVRLSAHIKVDTEAICSVRTKGIIGEKFIRLEPGGGTEFVKPGGLIRETVSGVDLQDLVSQFIHGKL